MLSAFDSLLDMLNNNVDIIEEEIKNIDTIDTINNEQMEQFISDANAINADKITIHKQSIEVNYFDPAYNLLDDNVKLEFESEVIFRDTKYLTLPHNTTNTVEGYLSNVVFHEKDLIEHLEPDENIVRYKCNFGDKSYPTYNAPTKIKISNRGRKKKEKPKKLRKKQGFGTDFNTQITFVAVCPTSDLVYDYDRSLYEIPYKTREYKYKVFRNGKVQLTGVKQDRLDEIINRSHNIASILNDTLHPFEKDITNKTYIINVNLVMKNYKFVAKMPNDYIINLSKLHKIVLVNKPQVINLLAADKAADTAADKAADTAIDKAIDLSTNLLANCPHICVIKYSRSDTKLSIKFSTPITNNHEKITRVNIFMRGKINILGALDSVATNQICEYLEYIFGNYYDEVIVPENNIVYPLEQNVEINEQEISELISGRQQHKLLEFPYISQEEYTDILNMTGYIYDSYRNEVNTFLEQAFNELAKS